MNLPPPFVPQIPDDLRMQANDLLSHCLETGQEKPLHQVVENLLLVGPSAFYTLNALLLETSQRRAQIEDEIHRAIGIFHNKIAEFGLTRQTINDPFACYEQLDIESILLDRYDAELNLSPQTLNLPAEAHLLLLEAYHTTKDKLNQLIQQYLLSRQLENYLEDWLWGMAYQTVQQLHAIPLTKSSHIVL